MKTVFYLEVRYGKFDNPTVCRAKRVEQVCQGWFRIVVSSGDRYVSGHALISITLVEETV